MAPGSPAQMVQHSPDFRNMLKRIVSEHQTETRAMSSLRAAKHRFESFAKPLSRTIRLFHCLHILMVDIANTRTDNQGDRAMKWIEWVSATPRRILLGAMLADASDEALQLTRFADVESMDPAKLTDHVENFLARSEALFGESRQCLHAVGYTQLTLEFLAKPFVRVARGRVFTLAQVKDSDIQWCLDRLRGWLVLAHAEVKAEFPCWEVAQAFRIFNIGTTSSSDISEEEHVSHLECLAKVVGVNAMDLRSQYDAYSGFAEREIKASRCNAKDGWQRALQMVSKRQSSIRGLYPDFALRPVLYRYFAFAASSSGVEQTFTQAQIAVTDRQQSAGRLLDLAYTRIKVDGGRDDPVNIIQGAQSVWGRTYGIAKVSGSDRLSRIDKGTKRKLSDAKTGEAAFVRARRGSLALSRPSDVEERIQDMNVDCWSAEHEAELDFAKNKLQDRKAQAYREGVLVEEASADVVERAAKKVKSELDGAVRRDKKELKHMSANIGGKLPSRSDLSGMPVYVCKEHFKTKLIRWGLERADYLWQSKIIVCTDVGNELPASTRVWAAALLGCYVMAPGVLDNSTTDVCIKYNCAVMQRRRLHISDKFQEQHPRSATPEPPTSPVFPGLAGPSGPPSQEAGGEGGSDVRSQDFRQREAVR